MKAALRALSRNRIIRKRLPSDLGHDVVFCSPDALLSMWKPGWRSSQAQHLFAWARRFVNAGDTVWDVGANQGLFTFAAAARSGPNGRVVAFEPDPFLIALMHRSKQARHGGAPVDLLPIALGDSAKVATLCVATKDRALNHLAEVAGNPRTGGDRERFPVVTVTLAWAVEHLPVPHLIKIDVEGAELMVLQSAGTRLLHDVRPRWIIEVAAENAIAIASLLRQAGYRMFDVDAPDKALDYPAWNTLAVPNELS